MNKEKIIDNFDLPLEPLVPVKKKGICYELQIDPPENPQPNKPRENKISGFKPPKKIVI